MFRRLWTAFFLLTSVPFAGADPEGPPPAASPSSSPPPSLNTSPPKSVWDIDMDGSATHLQSGLVCPHASGDFIRVDVIMYDRLGFDVSCGYNGRAAAITLYLTRRDPSRLDADFQDEKQQVVSKTPSAAPNDGALLFSSNLDWKSAGFSERNGALRSDLWLASLSGWEFQIRATYAANDTARVAAALVDLSADVEKSAGAHLAACAASPQAQRGGAQKVVDDAALLKLSLSGAMGAVAAGNNPANWCADGAFQVGPTPFILWRNIGAPGKVNFADRITPVLGGTTIFVMADEAGNEMLAKSAPGSTSDIYDVVVDRGDVFALAGIFNGHPAPRDFASLMVVGGAYGIFSTAGKTDKKISIFKAPPQQH
jgi:hypothetical protein